MSKNDFTPRERGMLRALQHSAEPLSLRQLGEKTGYKSIQSFRSSIRFLEAEKLINSSVALGEKVYSFSPKKDGL